jgi:pimeloyl-ACP methyl ester carboxylesterase
LARPGARVILQGHSLGALKIVRCLHDRIFDNLEYTITAAVLLAPFDIVAFNAGKNHAEVEQNRETVRQILLQDPNALVPREVFAHWPISAKTYLQITESGGQWDVFPSRDDDNHREWIRSCEVPALIAIGREDFAAFPNPISVVQALTDLEGVSAHVVPDAPHNFAGQESILGAKLRDFLSQLK